MRIIPAIVLSFVLLSVNNALAANAPPPVGLWNGHAVTSASYKLRLWLKSDGSYV